MLRWFETHAHLCDAQFDADRDEAVERAKAVGMAGMVEIADGPAEWEKARAFAARHDGFIRWAGGIHPYHADQASAETWRALQDLAADPRFVAIGEVGLDYAKCPVPREVQTSTFEQALDLAAAVDKPLVIHCRDAYADLMPILRNRTFPAGRSPGVVHCFSGDAAQAVELTGMGFYLGVDGPVTYPGAGRLRDALAAVPLENLVLETDSPYLPPQTIRGKRNEPARLPEIGLRLIQEKGASPAQACAVFLENSLRLYRLTAD